MWWQTAELQRRIRSIQFLWAGFAAAALLWALCCGDLADVALVARSPWVVAFHEQLRWLNAWSMYPFYVFFIGMLLWGWQRQQPQWRLLSWGYLIAQLAGSVLLVRTLKMLIGHARPDFTYLGSELADRWVGPTSDASFNGFPSGHTTDLFISAIFLSVLLPKAWMRGLVLAFAAFNGVLRIALAKHFPLDVLGGVLLGGLVALLVLRFWVVPRLQRYEVRGAAVPAVRGTEPGMI